MCTPSRAALYSGQPPQINGWSAVHCMPPLTTGGQHVHRRHHVPRELANLVAELAGLGRKRDR